LFQLVQCFGVHRFALVISFDYDWVCRPTHTSFPDVQKVVRFKMRLQSDGRAGEVSWF
jgi:isocitrate dehydrogenase kinase/phosphatase